MPSVHGIHDWDGLTYSPSGCGWYRIILPLMELGKQDGWDVTWRPGQPPNTRFDVVAGQRLDKPDALGTWRRLSMISRTVYDIDDDIWNIRPSNWTAYRSFDAVARDAVEAFARYSTLVTVSTYPLAEIMRRHTDAERIVVLPNHVPGWLLDHQPRRTGEAEQRAGQRVVVGWSGGSSHAEDLQMIARPVSAVLADHPDTAELHLLGVDFRRTFVKGIRTRYTPWIPIAADGNYYRAIDFDIALAPLLGSVFDESKSAIKALEAMALGIPVIASALTPYRGFVIDGVTGYLIDRKRRSDWGRRLRELIHEPQQRAEMGAKAREVARAHVIENGWRLWADAYKELI